MPVKIRLMRIGAKKRPFFRVVAVDEQKKRTGAYLELLGTYNPLTEPKEIILKQDRIDDWMKKGAQPSEGFLRIIGKAPQRPPRKAKKEQKPAPAEAAAQQPAKQAEEAKTEESAAEEAEAAPTEQIDAPVVSEESIAEAPAAEPAAEAAKAFEESKPAEKAEKTGDVILGNEAEPLPSGDEVTPESNTEVDAGHASMTDEAPADKADNPEEEPKS